MKKLEEGYWLSSDGTVYKEARNLLKFTDSDGIERQVWEVTNYDKVTEILKKNLPDNGGFDDNLSLHENNTINKVKKVNEVETTFDGPNI